MRISRRRHIRLVLTITRKRLGITLWRIPRPSMSPWPIFFISSAISRRSIDAASAERRKADYIVRLNWKIGRSQIGVYRTNGDLVGVDDKSSINGSVKAACELIKRDLPQTAAKTEKKPDPAPTK